MSMGNGGSAGGQPRGDDVRDIVIISAGVSEPSSSTLLGERLAAKTLAGLRGRGVEARVSTIELRALALDVAKSNVAGFVVDSLRPAVERLAAADGVIAATPVYKAGVSGLFKSFIDVLDDDLLIGKPVAVTATAGSARHALVPDEQLRPLFAYLRALVIPTALFAGPEDWGAPALGERIERAAIELAALVASGVGGAIAAETWSRHEHRFGGAAGSAAGGDGDGDAGGDGNGSGARGGDELSGVDFDSELMRLATGGGRAGAGN
ncbi:CE1759 family FMN reductase [Actinospica robiniae]|uniref:CE1759 family FMN reductase n=1 Tax=Actinospica robiniae TaxID=304901 RepID=UPI000405241E|nr:CE1759 family FMN reductase [Actinospica robiniae]